MMRILLVSSGYYRGEKTHIDQIRTIPGIEWDLIVHKQSPESNEKPYTFTLASAMAIAKQIKKKRYSGIHCHGFQASVFIRLLDIVTTLPPIVYTIHGFHCAYKTWSIKAWVQLYLERRLNHRQAHTICVSQSDRTAAIQNHCIGSDRSSVIHNGVSPMTPAATTNPITMFGSEDTICVSTGTLEWRKGYDVIVKAAELLADAPHITFVFVGDGPLMPALKQSIKQKGLTHRIYLAGHQQHVGPWLANSHIYISASRWEGLPYGILEAFQYQLPTIASQSPGIVDCVSHDKNGRLFEPNNAHDLAKNIRQLAHDKRLQQRYVNASNHRLTNEFSEDTMTTALKGIYDTHFT
jgi:glycosyltransferase involved in cell wall biosynthesis